MEEKVFAASFATVLYDADKSLGKIIWHGTPTREEYKQPFTILIEMAKNGKRITRFLSDIREQGVVSPESRKWFEHEMVPAAVANGLKRAAVVSAANAFKMYYINLILSAVNKFNLPFKIFNSEEKALEFLLSES